MGQATELMKSLNEDDMKFMEKLIENAKAKKSETQEKKENIAILATGNKGESGNSKGGTGITREEFESAVKEMAEIKKQNAELKDALLRAQAQGKATISEPNENEAEEKLKRIFAGTGLFPE